MDVKDPYATLGVEKTAKPEDIRNAYRNLAKKYHPDLNPGSKAAESKFKEISRAYEMVGTPDARAKFDRGEFEGAEGAAAGPDPFGFGGRGGRGPFYSRTQAGPDGQGGRYSYSFADGFDEDLFSAFSTPPEDEVYRMDVDLADTIAGAEREIHLPSGKKLRVKIPPGVGEGSRLRFAAQGAPARRSGKPVDVYVELHIRPDPRFEVSGNDLILRLPISVGDAVFGGEVRAPTVESSVLLKIPPRSNTGKRLRLRGKGLYDRATKARGDQVVILEIMLPDPIDPEFEAALKQWQDKRKPGGTHDGR
jgi:DnaJ-class molecular chaperone